MPKGRHWGSRDKVKYVKVDRKLLAQLQHDRLLAKERAESAQALACTREHRVLSNDIDTTQTRLSHFTKDVNSAHLQGDLPYKISAMQLKELESLPKTIVKVIFHKFRIPKGEEFSKTSFYCVAPKCSDASIPCFFLFTVTQNTTIRDHFSISLYANTSGKREDFVFIGRVDNHSKKIFHVAKIDGETIRIGHPHYHTVRADQLTDEAPQPEEIPNKGTFSLEEAVRFMVKRLNINTSIEFAANNLSTIRKLTLDQIQSQLETAQMEDIETTIGTIMPTLEIDRRKTIELFKIEKALTVETQKVEKPEVERTTPLIVEPICITIVEHTL